MERPALPPDFGPLDSEDGNVNRWWLCECADTILLLRFLSLFLYVCLELVLNLNMSFIIMVDMNYFSNKQRINGFGLMNPSLFLFGGV